MIAEPRGSTIISATSLLKAEPYGYPLVIYLWPHALRPQERAVTQTLRPAVFGFVQCSLRRRDRGEGVESADFTSTPHRSRARSLV
jgi:hypothetical protein